MLQEWCALKEDGRQKHTVTQVSYGRAAKAVSVYLKTAVGMRDKGHHRLQPYLHPPIDRVLLSHMRNALGYTVKGLPKWTALDEEGYGEVMRRIAEWMRANRCEAAL